MSGKQRLVEMAAETCEIIDSGVYDYYGCRVEITKEIEQAKHLSACFSSFQDLKTRKKVGSDPRQQLASVHVTDETTLACSTRLRQTSGIDVQISALNFASAKNVGGGFKNGAYAQEESLARASALYGCLTAAGKAYYESNRQTHDGIYTDHIIWSPHVPVFREDKGELLEKPYPLSFITVPAVNAGVVAQNKCVRPKEVAALVEKHMRNRIQMLLYMAAAEQTDILILGAFGCGCFQNSSADVARWFREELQRDCGFYLRQFQQIVFAVYDTSKTQSTLRSFTEEFGRPVPAEGAGAAKKGKQRRSGGRLQHNHFADAAHSPTDLVSTSHPEAAADGVIC
eukprot:CAMPEP_0177700330 /NCGR_PEP_ID=MMETSP0484_2-20121128/6039_1 /TAXON_ID=354590 /ORGANISM="Rhodomonas lens, Strain RHODO" /LENGTH=340 /DNA_ID=CAMNT_0019211527 /DNA_START=56 /DNA_END=1078 /DNA_ORIENTATION=-